MDKRELELHKRTRDEPKWFGLREVQKPVYLGVVLDDAGEREIGVAVGESPQELGSKLANFDGIDDGFEYRIVQRPLSIIHEGRSYPNVGEICDKEVEEVESGLENGIPSNFRSNTHNGLPTGDLSELRSLRKKRVEQMETDIARNRKPEDIEIADTAFFRTLEEMDYQLKKV